MRKLLASILVLLLSLFLLTPLSLAKENVAVQEVSSFELFWPVSAGKTLGDSLYGLKALKEKIRGVLIFGKMQKVDYSLFLATKRVVETEKLLNDGKADLAKKTLDKMAAFLETAELNTSIPQELKGKVETDEINKKLDNLEVFLKWLATKNDQVKDQLISLLDKVEQINRKI